MKKLSATSLVWIGITVVLDVVMILVCWWFYRMSIHWGKVLTQMPYKMFDMLYGTFGVLILITVFNWVKPFTVEVVKCFVIYSVVHPECSVGECVDGVLGNKLTSVSIPIANMVIRKSINAMFTATDNVFELESHFPLLERIKNSKIAVAAASVYNATTSFVDECVMAYCYRKEDGGLGRNAVRGIACFVKVAYKMVPTIISSIVLRWIVDVGAVIVTFGYLTRTVGMGWTDALTIVVVARLVVFVVNDAIVDNMLLIAIIGIFDRSVEEAIEKEQGNTSGNDTGETVETDSESDNDEQNDTDGDSGNDSVDDDKFAFSGLVNELVGKYPVLDDIIHLDS